MAIEHSFPRAHLNILDPVSELNIEVVSIFHHHGEAVGRTL